THVGVSRFRSYRARRTGAIARRRQNRRSSRRAFSRKAEHRSGRVLFAKRKFSLERGNVRLVSGHDSARIQSPRAGTRGLHLTSPFAERSLRNFARAFPKVAAHFVRLRDHGKSRSRFGGRSEFRLGRRWQLAGGRALFQKRRTR